MAIRNDISINWEVSPRQITIDSPSVECTMQDLLDTLRDREALPSNMDNQSIVIGSGKVVLDSEGNAVGLTVQLINATVGFETRLGPDWIECNLTGGNLSGLEQDSITVTTQVTHNNPYVNINKTSSVSATISENVISESLDYSGILHFDATNIGIGRGVGTEHPIGTNANPVNNIADGIAIATKYYLREVHTYSDIILDRDVSRFRIKGFMPQIVFYPNGFKSDLCRITDMGIDGDFNNSYVEIWNCSVYNALRVYGIINNSYHIGTISITANNNLNMADCESGVPGLDSPILDMTVGADTTYSSRAFSGGQTITNCDTINCIATLQYIGGGKPHLEPSCSSGLISVRGSGALDDRSTGTIVDTTAWEETTESSVGVWTEDEKQESLTYTRKASDYSEQANNKL